MPERLTYMTGAGPDCVRIIEEFERVNKLPLESTGHHEVAHSLQCKFQNYVQSFTKVVNGMGNPFLATGHELITLDTRAVMDDAVAVSLSKIHEVGQALHKEYVNTRLDKVTVPMSDTIKRKNMFTFANRLDPRKKESKVGILKQYHALHTTLPFSSTPSRRGYARILQIREPTGASCSIRSKFNKSWDQIGHP